MARQNPITGWMAEDYRNTLTAALDEMREHGAEPANLVSARVAVDRLQEAGDTAGLAGVAGELDGYEQQLHDEDRPDRTEEHGPGAGGRAVAGVSRAVESADGRSSDAASASGSGATRQYYAFVKTALGRDEVVYVRADSEDAAIDAAAQHLDVAVVIDAFESRDLGDVEDSSDAELHAAASVACAGAAAAVHEALDAGEFLESGAIAEELCTHVGADAAAASGDEDGGFR